MAIGCSTASDRKARFTHPAWHAASSIVSGMDASTSPKYAASFISFICGDSGRRRMRRTRSAMQSMIPVSTGLARGVERLGASDQAVVEFRKQMVASARAFAEGKPAIGTGAARVSKEVCSFQAVMPKTVDWRTIQSAGDIAAAVSAA